MKQNIYSQGPSRRGLITLLACFIPGLSQAHDDGTAHVHLSSGESFSAAPVLLSIGAVIAVISLVALCRRVRFRRTPAVLVACLALPMIGQAHVDGTAHFHVAPWAEYLVGAMLFLLFAFGLVALCRRYPVLSAPVALAILVAAPKLADAHHVMNSDKNPFMGGLTLPIHGFDHLLAMVAVGLWAASGSSRQRWVLPLSFIGFMLLGMVLGLVRLPIPFVGTGIWVSVVALGLMLAVLGKMPNRVVAVAAGAFGIFHGYACGADLPNAWSPLPYGLGLILCTLALMAAGLLIGALVTKWRGPQGLRIAGACTAVAMLTILLLPLLQTT